MLGEGAFEAGLTFPALTGLELTVLPLRLPMLALLVCTATTNRPHKSVGIITEWEEERREGVETNIFALKIFCL